MAKLLHRSHSTSTLPEVPTTIEMTEPENTPHSALDAAASAGHAGNRDTGLATGAHGGGPDGTAESMSRFDGRSRRRQAALVVGVALLTGAAGVGIGSRVRSPADAAADRAAPTASRITAAVSRQALESTLVLSGEIQFTDPAAIILAGSVGVTADEAQVVTRVPAVDASVAEGDVPFEVSGRPIFFLQGQLPMYRKLSIGMTGLDVAQLEASLARLGFAPGTPEQAADAIFDQATADALTAMYAAAGYPIESASADQAESVRLAQESVTAADQALRDAQAALVAGAEGAPASQVLQLRQSVDAAAAAVPVAEQQRTNDIAGAQQDIDEAVATRQQATAERDAAAAALTAANQAGALDPNTGEPVTQAFRDQLNRELAGAEATLRNAERALTGAQSAQPVIKANADAALQGAKDGLALAQAQLSEGTKPVDTTLAQQGVAAATVGLEQAKQALIDVSATAGPRVSPGEIVFLPVLPSTLTGVDATLGSPANQQLGTVSTSDITVRAAVSRADSGVVVVGSTVMIQLRDVDLEVDGTVLSIGSPAPAPTSGVDGEQQPTSGEGANDSGRLEVVVLPDDPTALRDYVFYGAKLRIAVASTDGDVLVVPVSALTVGADGNSRVMVEESPITADSEGETRSVSVTVGLSANGLAEISPIAGERLEVGDAVIVGVE